MATRFYPLNVAGGVTPVANGTWNDTSGAVTPKALALAKSGTRTVAGQAWTAGQTALGLVAVSEPIVGAQTISGTFKSQMQCYELAGTDNCRSRIEAYVVSGDGTTVRGTLFAIALAGPNTEYSTSQRNKTFADGDAISSVDAQDGDRVVVCWGHTDATGTTPQADLLYGGTDTDLPENETTTTNGAGWVEFSADISFSDPDITMAADHGVFSLAGQHVNQTLVAEVGTISLSGIDAGGGYGMPADMGSFGEVGQDVASDRGTTDHGVFALAGQDVQFIVVHPISVEVLPQVGISHQQRVVVEPAGTAGFVVVDRADATIKVERPVPGTLIVE